MNHVISLFSKEIKASLTHPGKPPLKSQQLNTDNVLSFNFDYRLIHTNIKVIKPITYN